MKLFIITLLLITFSFAENSSLEKINDINGTSILIKAKKENCLIKNILYNNSTTNCTKTVNSKDVTIYCTNNKKVCKTEGELKYFYITSQL